MPSFADVRHTRANIAKREGRRLGVRRLVEVGVQPVLDRPGKFAACPVVVAANRLVEIPALFDAENPIGVPAESVERRPRPKGRP